MGRHQKQSLPGGTHAAPEQQRGAAMPGVLGVGGPGRLSLQGVGGPGPQTDAKVNESSNMSNMSNASVVEQLAGWELGMTRTLTTSQQRQLLASCSCTGGDVVELAGVPMWVPIAAVLAAIPVAALFTCFARRRPRK